MESRLAKVVLLDGSQLDFVVTPELLTLDLVELISSYLDLNEKEYFGLSFIDSTGHKNWLQNDKKILDHDLPKKSNNSSLLTLSFSVKYFIENIAFTKDKVAVELFYLQARQLIYQGELEVGNDLIFELGALVLQSLFGDYKNEKEAIKGIRSQYILPKRLINSPTQLKQSEEKVINHYKKCSNMNRGQCIVNFLSIIEKLCNYGVHFYEVKDKLSVKYYLGISFRGIGLYEFNNRVATNKIFPWCKLENLYYRDRKFSIEVHERQDFENDMSQLSTNENKMDDTFNPVKVYSWFASLPSLCKSIWLMAVAQHQFYLDKKQNRDSISQFKSLNDLALELNNSTSELLNFKNIREKSSPTSLISNEKSLFQKNAAENSTKSELLSLFKRKKELILHNIETKKKQLTELHTKQKEITDLVKQSQFESGNFIFKIIKILDKFKVAFVDTDFLKGEFNSKLLLEYDIQKKIMLISLNLASDPYVSNLVQKQRRKFYETSKNKLSQLERKLNTYKDNQKVLYYDGSNSSHHSQMSNSNSEVIMNFIENDLLETSPASIHRKDSYRRAQEQKLFLESNSNYLNKQNRMNQGRKVRTILNRELVQEHPINESSTHLKTLSEETLSSEHSNTKKFTLFTDHSSSSSSNELMCTPQVINENNKLFEMNRNFKTAIIKNTNNFMNNANTSITSSQNSQTGKFNNFNTSESNPELGVNSNSSSSLFMDKVNGRFDTLPNNQYHHNHHLHHHHFQHHNHAYQNHNVNSHHFTSNNGNGTNGNNGNSGNHSVISMNNAELRRKNTSDSNVKMLAEHHNFYHVNNRRMILMNRQQQRAAAAAAASASCTNSTSGSTTPSGNNEHSFNLKELSDTLNNSGATLQRHADLNEIYKAHMKYKRGMNSSSNSLVSLNSSSAGTNDREDSDREIVKSNPDIKASLKYSPKIAIYNNNNNNNGNIPSDQSFNKRYTPTHSNNQSNNHSLNLSIHTAEEFGIEMLAWLNNESSKAIGNQLKNIADLKDSHLIDNATLV